MTAEELDNDIAECKRKIAHYERMTGVEQKDMLVGSAQEVRSGAELFLRKHRRQLEILELAKKAL